MNHTASSTGYNGSVPDSPVASSSTGTVPFAQPAPPPAALEHADLYAELANHLLDGWTKPSESFSDCQLQVNYADGTQSIFSLHGLMASRAPLLRPLLLAAFAIPARPALVFLPVSDPHITPSSLALVLASLYSPTVLSHLSPTTAPSVLATASFLGLERLAALALEICEASVAAARSAEDVLAWVAYVERDAGAGSGATSPSRSSSPLGAGKANGLLPLPSAGAETYAARLRALLMERVVRLPGETGAFDPATAAQAQAALIDVLKRLPFEMFKAVVEDARFTVPTDMDRFNFAKKVVAARKQLAAAIPHSAGAGAGVADFEETVVLQFGGGAGTAASAVSVLRKARRPQLSRGLVIPPPPGRVLVEAMDRTLAALTRHYPRREETVAQSLAVLEVYRGLLNPEQEDYTYDDGRVELLLSLTGVVPVPVGASTYHCPLRLWLPLDFPSRPPIVYVVPSETLAVRKGRNVDASGKVGVPYLDNWERKSEGCSLMSLIADLIPVFSHRYPVTPIQPKPRAPPPAAAGAVEPQATGGSSSGASQPPPPRPPPPPGASGSTSTTGLPPRPPLPPQVAASRPASMLMEAPARPASAAGAGTPPRPPLPPGVGGPPAPPPLPRGLPGSFSQPPGPPPAYPAQTPPQPPLPPHRSSSLAYGSPPPPLPPMPQPPFRPPVPPTGLTPPGSAARQATFDPASSGAPLVPPVPHVPMSPPQPPMPYPGGSPAPPPPPGYPVQPPPPSAAAAQQPAAQPYPPQAVLTQQPPAPRPYSPAPSTVRTASPAPQPPHPPAAAQSGPPQPREEHYRQSSIDSVHTHHALPAPPPARRATQHQQPPSERAYSPAPSEAASYASYAAPPQPPAPRRVAEHGRRTSHGSIESYHSRGPPPSRQPHPSERERERYAASPAPPASEVDSYASPPLPQQGRVRPSPQPSEFSAAGEYGSYLPPASVTSFSDASDTYARSGTASYQPRQARGGYYADVDAGSAFEPVIEQRHAQQQQPPRQASLDSHYTSVSAREAYHPQQQLPPPVAPYGALPYHAAPPSSVSSAASPPRTNGAPPPAAAPAARAQRRAKPKHAPLNILDLAEEDALSPPGSPASPSAASASAAGGAPPPVPPNPALLALRTRVHSKLSGALSSLAASVEAELAQLDLMRVDLEKAAPAIEDEMARLEAVRSVCENVRGRYAEVVDAAEGRMREYEARGEGVDVDEIVCGSTVVYTQLLDLVAEDAALEDTIYALGRGLNSGGVANIDLDRFLKRVRLLAKEQFTIRATINKILLGLAVRRDRREREGTAQSRAGTPAGGAAGNGRGTPASAEV
ncbi:Suppressor protein stp22 of temperature-sensitive alpha-factor receptor and arginine permease [Rhodotorula kratochvilovae]